jgi:hypothetical protein
MAADPQALVKAIKEREKASKKNFTFRLDEKAVERLKSYCEANHIPMSALLEEWMARLPDMKSYKAKVINFMSRKTSK